MGRVSINPKALKWARIDAGYDYSNLPNKIKPKYAEWESGKLMPTWNQLRDISRYFKRPTAFFFRQQLPEHTDVELIEYRRLSGFQTSKKSPELTLGIREAITKRKIFMELRRDMGYPAVSFSKFHKNSGNSFELAGHIRNILNVDLKTQKSWLYKNGRKDRMHYNFLNNWKDRISSEFGALIFEMPKVSLDEMRALCICFEKFPIILLNSADSPNARIFSLFHELAHLIMGESAICDVDRNNSKEWLCNSVSAEFLVPKDDLAKNPVILNKKSGNWTDRELSRLSHEYGVSRQSMLLRLINTNRAPQSAYDSMKEQWNLERKHNSSKGGSPVLNQIKYNGRAYSSLVLAAYENGLISDVEFSQDMGLRLKHVGELSQRLFG